MNIIFSRIYPQLTLLKDFNKQFDIVGQNRPLRTTVIRYLVTFEKWKRNRKSLGRVLNKRGHQQSMSITDNGDMT